MFVTAGSGTVASETPSDLASLNALLIPYRDPDILRSLFQLANTALPLLACWAAMYWALARGWWGLAALLLPPTVGFLMRLFILQHDCGHGSFFRSQRANDIVGGLLGILTMTPYKYWRQTHAIHHATSGSLDRRGWGDIDTRTVEEYLRMTPRARRLYRLYRSLPVLFVLGPIFHFLVYHRLTWSVPADWKKERLSVLRTDLALAGLLLLASRTIGVGAYLALHLPVVAVASVVGVWFFYVQHQFEESYWRRDGDWNFARASLDGSSYYELPRVLQWFTGNIGFHHIHHLNSRIPNYRLERCMKENPVFQKVTRLTLRDSLRCVRLALWDEKRARMVGFDAVLTAVAALLAFAAPALAADSPQQRQARLQERHQIEERQQLERHRQREHERNDSEMLDRRLKSQLRSFDQELRAERDALQKRQGEERAALKASADGKPREEGARLWREAEARWKAEAAELRRRQGAQEKQFKAQARAERRRLDAQRGDERKSLRDRQQNERRDFNDRQH